MHDSQAHSYFNHHLSYYFHWNLPLNYFLCFANILLRIFKLSHQAPPAWCNEFNTLLAKHPAAPKIKEKEGLYIEGWVRNADEIIAYLETLKAKVEQCSQNYIARIERSAREADASNVALTHEAGEQGRLNRIVAALEFDQAKVD